MKKSKRILALIGAVLLLCLYGSTLIFAFVLLYAYTLVYRLSQKKKPDDSDEDQ